MENITSEPITTEDINVLQEYLEKLEELDPPVYQVTEEEWKDFFKILEETGSFPEKYRGRIAENEIEDKGKKKTTYYDVAFEEANKKLLNLNQQYHDVIIKALLEEINEGFKENENTTELANAAKAIIDEKKRKIKAAQMTEFSFMGSVPNGEVYNFWQKISACKNGRIPAQGSRNRHEELTTIQEGEKMRYKRKNKQNGSEIVITVDQADKFIKKTGKTFAKLLQFTFQKMTQQNFPSEVIFPLQELVDLGMYSNTTNAWRAVLDFFDRQAHTTFSGTVMKGGKEIKLDDDDDGGILFYRRRKDKGFAILYFNDGFNTDFFTNYYTYFPRFAYRLNINAFYLVRYIFSLARQNHKKIKETGTFTVSLDAVREALGLPSVDEVKKRKHKQYIREPIEEAIEEIEMALLDVPEAKDCAFTITPYGTDTTNIYQWLNGYLEIGLKGDFAKPFINFSEKSEKKQAAIETAKKAKKPRKAKTASI